jgi:hypothetical protein
MGKPQARDGALASKLGTTERTDGKTEVSYNGHPLYYYVGDTKAGDTTGQGLDLLGAEWNLLFSGRREDRGRWLTERPSLHGPSSLTTARRPGRPERWPGKALSDALSRLRI